MATEITTLDQITIDLSVEAKILASWRVELEQKYEGRTVVLRKGKYAGRKARINGMTPDVRHGWLFCCYVLRMDGKDVLNTDGESRAYRSPDEFYVLPWEEGRP